MSYISVILFRPRSAIEEGKGIYNNIKNFVRFQLSTWVMESYIFDKEIPWNNAIWATFL